MPKRTGPRIGSLVASLALATAALTFAGPAAAEEGSDPDAPDNLRVTDLQSDQFTVEWDEADATYYQVKLYISGASTHHTSTIKHEAAPATFTGLGWGFDYEVAITAVNTDHRDSDRRYLESERLEVTTALPNHCDFPSAPGNLRAAFDDQDRPETLSWDASTEGCSTLTYDLHAEGVGSVWSSRLDADEYHAHLYDLLVNREVLEPGETYTFWATATDIRDNVSPPSESVTLTMPDELPEKELTAPDNLRAVVNDDGFVERLEWDPATGGVGTFTYDVRFRYGTDSTFQTWLTTNETFEERQLGTDFFVECTPSTRPSDEMVLRIVAVSGDQTSAPSNEVSICFP